MTEEQTVQHDTAEIPLPDDQLGPLLSPLLQEQVEILVPSS